MNSPANPVRMLTHGGSGGAEPPMAQPPSSEP
jgi:hypothetical protein